MALVLVGVLLVALKFLEVGPVADWSWWIVIAPFFAAMAWWGYADSSGLTARRQAQKVDERAKLRRERGFEALGLSSPKRRR